NRRCASTGAKLAPLFGFGDTRLRVEPRGGNVAIATGEAARAHDVLVARPDHLEQADVLAERLGRKPAFGWKQILRWSGCQVLARGLDEARAARVARLAAECGLTPRVRPSRQRGPFLGWISRNSGKLGRAIWVTTACAEFAYLYLYDHY